MSGAAFRAARWACAGFCAGLAVSLWWDGATDAAAVELCAGGLCLWVRWRT